MISFSRLRPWLAGWVYVPVEAFWKLLFRIAGWSRPAGWQALAPGRRVVVLAPHADDETIGAGGAIALHRQMGDPVCIVVLSDGRASRAGGFSPDAMAAARREEVAVAAAILDAQWICLDLPEGQWDSEQAAPLLLAAVQDADLIYAPSCVDFHPEHLRTALLLQEVLQDRQIVRCYEIGVPLGGRLANCVLNITTVHSRKQQALQAYHTQSAALQAIKRLANYRSAFYGAAAVEVFRELAATGYREMIQHGNWLQTQSPFRGIRYRPFSDPLAWLVGWRQRRRLCRVG